MDSDELQARIAAKAAKKKQAKRAAAAAKVEVSADNDVSNKVERRRKSSRNSTHSDTNSPGELSTLTNHRASRRMDNDEKKTEATSKLRGEEVERNATQRLTMDTESDLDQPQTNKAQANLSNVVGSVLSMANQRLEHKNQGLTNAELDLMDEKKQFQEHGDERAMAANAHYVNIQAVAEFGKDGCVTSNETTTIPANNGFSTSNVPLATDADRKNPNKNTPGYSLEEGKVGTVYYPNFEADTGVMAEIHKDGVVKLDEAGGIQAFVAETIAIDENNVDIIKSDAEIEKEEKKRYSKYFMLAVAAIFLTVVAIAVPLTLKFAKGNKTVQLNYITQPPTDSPSLMPSGMPSSMPTSERFMDIVKKLEPLSGDALYDQGSFQYNAAMWMADNDPINNGTGLSLNDPGFEQRYTLVLFYFALDGPNWVTSSGWLGETSECFWYGIFGVSSGCGSPESGGCTQQDGTKGSYQKVCRLAMDSMNNLYGEIPSELSYLDEMQYFQIQNDWLVGTIPPSIGSTWTKLSAFLVGGNLLTGSFPDTFANNEMLGTIFIDRNNLNGTFPSVFSTLKNLEWLDAEDNRFDGSLPDSIASLPYLRVLNVNNNSITGKIPDMWDESSLLEQLEVSDNQLTGPLPVTLGSAPRLQDFHASRNQLTGNIPESYYQWENLEELYLEENKLGGELPQTQEPFYDGLQELSIHSNGFKGNFPTEWLEPTFRIKVIELHNNQLTGTLSTANICGRLDPSRSYSRLLNLTADCDKLICDCCTACFKGGQLVQP